jgi:hypothetical protein
MVQTGPSPGPIDDLVQAGGRERLTPPGALQHDEDPVGAAGSGTLGVVVGRDGGEEPGRDGHDALSAALALGDEHSTLARPQVGQPQAEHLAAP